MPATKFVENFLPVLKASIDDVRNYHLHVALLVSKFVYCFNYLHASYFHLQRKYCGMDPSARDNTYKSFQFLWLHAKFANGVPSIHKLEVISNELAPPTNEVEYPASPILPADSPFYGDEENI